MDPLTRLVVLPVLFLVALLSFFPAWAQAPVPDAGALGDQWLTEQAMKSIVGQAGAVTIILVTLKNIRAVQGHWIPPIGILISLLLQGVFVVWPGQKTAGTLVLGAVNALVTYGVAQTLYEKVGGGKKEP